MLPFVVGANARVCRSPRADAAKVFFARAAPTPVGFPLMIVELMDPIIESTVARRD